MSAVTVGEVYQVLDAFAPFGTELPWDNCGLLVGDYDRTVTGIGVVLDITPDVIRSAKAQSLNLLVSHHPVIFTPLKRLSFAKIPALLAAEQISAICAHTNLDAAGGGVNDCLCRALGLSEIVPLADPETPGSPPIARIGRLPAPLPVEELARCAAVALSSTVVRYAGGGEVQTIAVSCGAGGDLLPAAAAACADLFFTGELPYHEVLQAAQLGLPVITAGHYDTEQPIKSELCRRFSEAFAGLPVAALPEAEPLRLL